ncbi:MAG: nicotinate-nucleotide--dimethylbenzimidazole phosphoribosyltransferase [Alphaproteobacteria bacterium]|nr:nicotinate-nucleotide--dimethylbenzimidazole phosphoribosyltransferase [Alphaproteobacteria bacterium]
MASLSSFRALLRALPGPDTDSRRRAEAREPQLTKPPGALGRLEELSAWLCAWQGRHPPRLDRPACVVFAGTHGVSVQGVSAFPSEVTTQMVANFKAGGAAINQLCRTFGVDLAVEALELGRPTGDISTESAMTEADCVSALAAGMAAVREDMDVLCLGEMGIANTTPAAAICLALFKGEAAEWTGPGTGVAGPALANKTAVVARAVARHEPALGDSIDVLRHLGGRELAAIVGAVTAARLRRVPVVLDGYVCTAAAAVLDAFVPGALDHCIVAHVSAEPGHIRLIERLGKRALFDLGMRLGEASGAVLAVGLLRAATACHSGMSTFAEAGVSDKG